MENITGPSGWVVLSIEKGQITLNSNIEDKKVLINLLLDAVRIAVGSFGEEEQRIVKPVLVMSEAKE